MRRRQRATSRLDVIGGAGGGGVRERGSQQRAVTVVPFPQLRPHPAGHVASRPVLRKNRRARKRSCRGSAHLERLLNARRSASRLQQRARLEARQHERLEI
jgi:hypothetical protein